MANFNSNYTGEQIDAAILRALPLDTFTTTDTTISNVVYHVLWKGNPSTTSNIYGIAIHPSNGKLYQIYKDTSSVFYAYPFASCTGNKVSNLNAEMLDGKKATDFMDAYNIISDAAIDALF